jgi:hypothetical protein
MCNRHSQSAAVLLAAVAIALFSAHSVARATLFTLPELEILVGPEGNLTPVTAQMLEANSESVVENSDGSFTFANGSMMVPDLWQWDWSSVTVKTDPLCRQRIRVQEPIPRHNAVYGLDDPARAAGGAHDVDGRFDGRERYGHELRRAGWDFHGRPRCAVHRDD